MNQHAYTSIKWEILICSCQVQKRVSRHWWDLVPQHTRLLEITTWSLNPRQKWVKKAIHTSYFNKLRYTTLCSMQMSLSWISFAFLHSSSKKITSRKVRTTKTSSLLTKGITALLGLQQRKVKGEATACLSFLIRSALRWKAEGVPQKGW